MRHFRSLFLSWTTPSTVLLTAIMLATGLAAAQDDDSQPSLGDVARQTRLQKQKQAQAAAKDQAASPPAGESSSNNAQTQGKDGKPAVAAAPNDAAAKSTAAKDSSAKDTLAKGGKKVITNDEIPEHVGPTSTLPQHPRNAATPEQQPVPDAAEGKVPAQYWKMQIQALKQAISDLEGQIQDVSDSIRYAGSNCVSNCAQFNAEQQQKQQQVQMMTSQLEQEQKNLENMQDTARKQGYGSSVYDP